MCIPTGVHLNTCHGCRRQVRRHHRRGASVEGERRFDHSAGSYRYELGNAPCVLLLQDRDRVTTRIRHPGRVVMARNNLTQISAAHPGLLTDSLNTDSLLTLLGGRSRWPGVVTRLKDLPTSAENRFV